MGKRAKAKLRAKNSRVTSSKGRAGSGSRNNKIRTIVRELRRVADEARDSRGSNDAGGDASCRGGRDPPASSAERSRSRDEGPAGSSRRRCYRCEHFLEMPRNLSRPFRGDALVVAMGRHEIELSFIQAVVWLKSVVAHASRIPYEELLRISDRFRGTGEGRSDDERPALSERAPISGKTVGTRDTLEAFSNMYDLSRDVTSERLSREDAPGAARDDASVRRTSINDHDDDDDDDDEYLTPQRYVGYVARNKTRKRFCAIAETDSESEHSFVSDACAISTFDSTIERRESEDAVGRSAEDRAGRASGGQIAKSVITGDESVSLLSGFGNGSRVGVTSDRGRIAAAPSEFVASTARASPVESSSHLRSNRDEAGPETPMSQPSWSSQFLSMSKPEDLSISDVNVSQMSASQINGLVPRDQWDFFDMQIDRSPSKLSIDHRDGEIRIGTYDGAGTRTNVTAVVDQEYDSALGASNSYLHLDCDEARTETPGRCSQFLPMTDPEDLEITLVNVSEIMNIAQVNEATPRESFGNTQTGGSLSVVSKDGGSDDLEIRVGASPAKIHDARANLTAVRNREYDGASDTDMFGRDETNGGVTARSAVDDECTSDDNNVVGHRYNLRSLKKRTSGMLTAAKCKIAHIANKDLPERRKEGGKEKTVPARFLSFTLDSLNTEHMILESLVVVLSALVDSKTAEQYALRRYWEGTLEKEAVNAVLNVSDIFKLERKPNVCRKEIAAVIIGALDEITMCALLNKTSVWVYRVQIISELCNSMPICIDVIDHLIAKLKPFKLALTEAIEKTRPNMYATVNQLHLVFYMLNIILQKYRKVIPRDRRPRSAEIAIPHVEDSWKTHGIEEELADMTLDLDTAEERWSNELEGFIVESTEYFFSQFAEKSLLLLRLLMSQ